MRKCIEEIHEKLKNNEKMGNCKLTKYIENKNHGGYDKVNESFMGMLRLMDNKENVPALNINKLIKWSYLSYHLCIVWATLLALDPVKMKIPFQSLMQALVTKNRHLLSPQLLRQVVLGFLYHVVDLFVNWGIHFLYCHPAHRTVYVLVLLQTLNMDEMTTRQPLIKLCWKF